MRSTDKTCVACSSSCLTCSGSSSSSSCTSCNPGRYLASRSCLLCQRGCSNCSSSTQCSACSQGYYLLSKSCMSCSTGCASCQTSRVCTSCLSGYQLQQDRCITGTNTSSSASLEVGIIIAISFGAAFCFSIIMIILCYACRKRPQQNSRGVATPTNIGLPSVPFGEPIHSRPTRPSIPPAGRFLFGYPTRPSYSLTPMTIPSSVNAWQPHQHTHPQIDQPMYPAPAMFGLPPEPYLQGQPPPLPPGFTSV